MTRIALLGCGRIAQRHAAILGDGDVSGASLAMVCDTRVERATALGERYEVPWFTNMDDMLEHSEGVDAVAVLTESGMHADHVVALAPHFSNVIVEKPMALTLKDADRMIHACDESSARLFVVKQNRFNLPIQHVRRAIEENRFGKIVMGTVRVRWCRRQDYYDQDPWRGTWALDGGVLANQASHHVDVLEWMLGEPQSVFAMSRSALADIEAEDTAAVLVRFASGALGVIEATTATRPIDLEGSLSILGERGTAVVGGFALNRLDTWAFDDGSTLEDLGEHSSNPPDVYGYGHKQFYQDVVRSIETGSQQLVDGLEGRRSLELITAIYESIETGQEVRLRFDPKNCRLGIRA